MYKTLLIKSLLLLCALIAGKGNTWADDVADVTYDVANGTVTENTLTVGGSSFSGQGNTNFKMNTGYFFLGKTGAYINFPTYTNVVEKIVVTGNSGASTKVKMNIYVGENIASTETTGSTGTNTYNIASDYQTVGSQYTLKVTSDHNAQITKIEVYFVKASTYTVTYDSNGADSGTVPTDNNTYDADNSTVTVLGNTGNLAKAHYTFADWNTKANGTGTAYAAGSTFTISANTTLYAQWNVNANTVTLPSADEYGSYTMDATNPVAYGREVALTYTPATGYDNYVATWSVNGTPIDGDTFAMPDETVVVTVSVAKKTTVDMTVDFEKPLVNYADWEANKIGISNSITAQGGSYYGYTTSVQTAYIQTVNKVNPVSLTCYISKTSNNTNTSTWSIQVSTDKSTWTEVKSTSASSMAQGEWKEFTADLSNYSNVYVRVYYDGTTAIRAIDDLTLTVRDSVEPSITADAVLELTGVDTTGEIAYTINNPVNGQSLSATTTANWISNITVAEQKVTFNTTVNEGKARTATITLTYGSITKEVTVTQAKHVVNTYTLATSVVPGRHYIIVGTNNSVYKAMGGQNTNNRSAVEITVGEGTTTVTSEDGVYEVLIGFDQASGYFTIYDELTPGYLYAAGGTSNNYMRTEETLDADGKGLWTIEFGNDGVASVKAKSGGKNVMRYNSSNDLFSCYGSGQNDIYLFERTEDTGSQDFSVSIAEACTDGKNYYGTFSAPFAFTVPAGVTVSEITVVDGELLVDDYASGNVIPANRGVMISSATAGEKTFTSAKGGTSVLGDDNCLRSTAWGVSAAGMTAAHANSLFYRLTMHNGSELGFWWGAAAGGAFSVGANKAYLAVPESALKGARAGFSLFGDEETGIAGRALSVPAARAACYNIGGQRVAKPTKGLYVVDGKKVIVK